ncbi:BatA domain-containing protein [Anatilimnocola sp. NA78]|uniref:BatA domain-containing protein n=1 Tax=Anatilimnocola sp. NA78 TaxID=3415683 RepID=UPI003CE49E02
MEEPVSQLMAGIILLAFWHFGSGVMLWWAAAAALPLLIHLWTRRQFRETKWAAMTFLLAAMQKHSRRIRLEQWLLLALRVAIPLVFALALANPQQLGSAIWQGLTGNAASDRGHCILVIDGSFSMDYRAAGVSRFDEARRLASEMIDQNPQGTGYSLLLMAQPTQTIIGDPAFEDNDVKQELAALEMTHGGANLLSALTAVEQTLGEAEKKYGLLPQRRVIFFSDLGKNTWGEVGSPECLQRLAGLQQKGIACSLVDVGQMGASNSAITELVAESPWITVQDPTTFRVDLKNENAAGNSATTPQRVTVALFVDGQRVSEQRVDLPAGGRASVPFVQRIEAAGEHVVEAVLFEDQLPVDNHRWRWLNVRKALSVLCIEGRQGEADHLILALRPQQNEARIEVRRATESELIESDLTKYDIVALCNVGRFSQNEGQVLRQYVERGGNLFVMLGDQAQAASYNDTLAGKSPLLPATIGEVKRGNDLRVDPLQYRHPLVTAFRGHQRSGLLTTPIWTYHQLQALPGANTALALSTGDPIYLEREFGRGCCLLLGIASSPLSLDRTVDPPRPWSALSTWPSFPPLMQEAAAFVAASKDRDRTAEVGQPVEGEFDGTLPRPIVILRKPASDVASVSEDRLAVTDTQGRTQWVVPGQTRSGKYELRSPAEGEPLLATFVVNPDTRESNLERILLEQLPETLRATAAAESNATASQFGPPKTWFRELLLGVFGLLLAESFVAWHLGRGVR